MHVDDTAFFLPTIQCHLATCGQTLIGDWQDMRRTTGLFGQTGPFSPPTELLRSILRSNNILDSPAASSAGVIVPNQSTSRFPSFWNQPAPASAADMRRLARPLAWESRVESSISGS